MDQSGGIPGAISTEHLRASGKGFSVPLPAEFTVPSTAMPAGAWRRWFARIVDIALMGAAWGITGMASRSGIENEYATSLVTGILLVPIAAGFLMEWGRTPGKAFMRLRVVDGSGRSPDFRTALKREVGVLVKGLAFFLPLISLFTVIRQYNRHREGLVASYEPSGVQVVGDERLTRVRIALAWITGLVILSLIAIGTAQP